MDERIRGSFPGGPRRREEGDEPRRAPTLRSVEEIEAGRSRRTLLRARKRRERWRAAVILLGMALGFAVGAALGLATHETSAELTDALETARKQDAEVSREVNRVLLELWKMEDAEQIRGRSRLP